MSASRCALAVTATNAYGKSVVLSAPTDAVSASPPHIPGRRIVGTSKGEYLAGGGHDDVIFGLGGNDTLLGGAGDDRIYGGAGDDVITGGSGADHLYGGAGSDTIFAVDGERDVVDCGPGNDRAVVDSVDVVVGLRGRRRPVARRPRASPEPRRRGARTSSRKLARSAARPVKACIRRRSPSARQPEMRDARIGRATARVRAGRSPRRG